MPSLLFRHCAPFHPFRLNFFHLPLFLSSPLPLLLPFLLLPLRRRDKTALDWLSFTLACSPFALMRSQAFVPSEEEGTCASLRLCLINCQKLQKINNKGEK